MSVSPLARSGSWWGNRTVRTKILATVGVAGVVAAGIGVMGLDALGVSDESAQALYGDNLIGVVAATDLDALVADMRVNTRDVILSSDPTKAIAAVEGLGEEFGTVLDAYRTGTAQPAKLAVVDEIEAGMAQYLDLQRSVLGPLARERDYAAWGAANSAQVAPVVEQVREDIATLRDLESAQAEAAATGIHEEYLSQRTTAIVLIVAGVGLALALGWFVASGIARATGRVKDVAQGLAEGDLTRTSGLTTQDELGQMGQALDAAVTELRGVMASVVASSDAVAAASEELSASSAQISSSAEETSAQSGVVSAAAEEVSRNVATVAAGAEQMGASIREISQNANEAARVAAQAVTEAETTNATVLKLGDSSREIGNVIKVITSIAEQT
ncbi:methyl-accepting chemotaxis protein, partial [Modestobacter marinus]